VLKQIVATSIVASTVVAAGAVLAAQPPSRGPGHKPLVSFPESRSVVSQTRFAVVEANGVTARGRGVVSSQSIGGGFYEVIFSRNVTKCAYVATMGDSGSNTNGTPGEIAVVGRFGKPNGVFLSTFDSTGALADRSFHLQVLCP
jgi:hypothetical protein